jgi:hypothetical protein
MDAHLCRESSLQVTKTTYSGLQEHRIIVYTATGQKAQPKVHMSTAVGVSPETFLLLLLQKPHIQAIQAKHQKHAEGKQRNTSWKQQYSMEEHK